MDNLEYSIVEAIKKEDLSSLSEDYGEVLFNSLMQDGTLKDIPIVHTIVALTKLGIDIKNRIFAKKLIKFLISLKDISQQDRETMILKLERDNSFKDKVGEHILLLLDKCNDMSKPTLIGNAFKSYIQGRITALELRKINFGIDSLFIPNIQYLKDFYAYRVNQLSEDIHQNLSFCGFVYILSGYGGLIVEKCKIGELFVTEVIKNEP